MPGSSPAGVTMVTVAQVVEQWIVVPPVASSSLVGHPLGRYTVICEIIVKRLTYVDFVI